MAEFNDIVKVAVDAYHGTVQKYSVSESMDTLRQALIEANGGKDHLDYKAMRNGANNGMFELIETILDKLVVEGLQGDEFFLNMVEQRNVALGDQNVFLTHDSDLFYVAEVARGTQGIRRQRIGEVTEVSIPTTAKAVKIYEELDRVLSGRVDFNYFISRVSESFRKQLLDDIYSLWAKATANDFGGNTYFPAAGSYNEDALLNLVSHVEAAAGGRPATLIGTKAALRNIKNSMTSIDAANDMYHMGYMGSFYGSPVIAVPQRHKINSTAFVLPDDEITIIAAADDKPIKLVYEGNSLIIPGNPLDNADLTQEYTMIQRYGTGIVLAGGQNSGIGRYKITK